MKLFSLAIATSALVAGAAARDSHRELTLDMSDVPRPCEAICRPIATLSKQCEVDLGIGKDKDEDLLHNQCVCTNQSFKVGEIAAQCADCMHQNVKASKKRDLVLRNDDDSIDADDVKDIDHLLSGCGFTSTKYNPTMATAAASITVDATAPANRDQLTTTIAGTHTQSTNGAPTGVPQFLYAGAAVAAAAAML